jgi:hypothetical protein
MIGGGKLVVRKCSIRNFTGNGVNVVGTANARAFVEDSLIIGNGGGVNLHGAGGMANTGSSSAASSISIRTSRCKSMAQVF